MNIGIITIIGWGLATCLWVGRQMTAAAVTYALAASLAIAMTWWGSPRSSK